MKNLKNIATKLGLLAFVGGSLLMGGCGSTAYKPEIAQATPTRDGVFYVDLRNKPVPFDYSDIKEPVERLFKESCALPENAELNLCHAPKDYELFGAQVRNAVWGKGPVFFGVFVPKKLHAEGMPRGSEKDGDIVRVRIIPGPVSLFVYDGVIERHDDPNRACEWKGSHNYSGGVVCQKYGYDYNKLDVSKL